VVECPYVDGHIPWRGDGAWRLAYTSQRAVVPDDGGPSGI